MTKTIIYSCVFFYYKHTQNNFKVSSNIVNMIEHCSFNT